MQSPFMTIAEFAAWAKVSKSLAYKMSMAGMIGRKHGRRVVIHIDEAKAWSESRIKAPKTASLSKFQAARLRVLGSLKTDDTTTAQVRSKGVA